MTSNALHKSFAVITMAFLGLALGKPLLAKDEASIHGSIAVKGLPAEQLPALAKLKPADAVKRALVVKSGVVDSVGLESEDGYLVYSVVVANKAGGKSEVLVDAGNGKVLEVEEKKEAK